MNDKLVYRETNPETIRAVVCGFISSVPNFHSSDSSGYVFVSDMIVAVDEFNSTVAAQICDDAFSTWLVWDESSRGRIGEVIKSLASNQSLSRQVQEIVTKALE
jgi:aminopeptidase N